MRRIFLTILCVSLVVLGVAGSASAFTYDIRSNEFTGEDFSGYYLFTVTDPQNDNIWVENAWSQADIDLFIEAINTRIFLIAGIEDYISELEFYGKYDFDEGKFEEKGEEFKVTFSEGTSQEGYYGSWSTLNGPNIEFYTVKASTEFAVYWMGQDGASSGLWSTEHLLNNGGNIPTISHLSLWNPSTETPPIPEPSTVFLLGLGLLGILGLGRKLKK